MTRIPDDIITQADDALQPGSETTSEGASKTKKASAFHPEEPPARAARKEGASPGPSAEPARVPRDPGSAEVGPEALSSIVASSAHPLVSLPSEIPMGPREPEILLRQGDRAYRVRGLAKNLFYDVLEVDLCVTLEPKLVAVPPKRGDPR
jgi:hypothetical protein